MVNRTSLLGRLLLLLLLPRLVTAGAGAAGAAGAGLVVVLLEEHCAGLVCSGDVSDCRVENALNWWQ